MNWRTHPDYRVTGSWETVTRGTLTDIGHAGRVFLGLVLASRHKRGRRKVEQSPVMRLLDADVVERAASYGLVFRLGAALSGASPGVLPFCRPVHGPGRLDLVLEGPAVELAGEEVEKRLRNLTAHLGVKGEVRVGAS